MKVPTRRTIVARRLAITSAALVGTALTPLPAFAQNGTWNGATADYNVGGNWTPAGVPTNIATLANNGQTTVAVTADSVINQVFFAGNAQAYEFINAANLIINGTNANGIVNASPLLQTVINNGTMTFNNNAMVGGLNGGTILFHNRSNAGSSPSLVFNNTSGLTNTVTLLSAGASVSAVGTNQVGANTSVTFNDASHADGVTMTFAGGNGGGQGGAGVAGLGVGGSQATTFNATSHADDATINQNGGAGIGQGGIGALSPGSGFGGSATLTFNGTSHADNADIHNRSGSGSALGGSDAAVGIAAGGSATIVFNGDSHADGATIENSSGVALATGGTGAGGLPLDSGAAGGGAQAQAGSAQIVFLANSHADNATIINLSSGPIASGGTGGAGGLVEGGGVGGVGLATGGSSGVTFDGNSHANGATITNGGTASSATGGFGGIGGLIGVGGAGGRATGIGGTAAVTFNGTVALNNVTITNTGGDAFATGGTGGTGGPGANGGTGGEAVVTGTTAGLAFTGSSTAGTGTTIINQGGNAQAIGGLGGTGGPSAGGAGGTGGAADATGGNAVVEFRDNASAGSATITNTAGSTIVTTGAGGNGDVGAGGAGGQAEGIGGAAQIIFRNNATAGSATIMNSVAVPIVATLGAFGTPGAGGGAGGNPGLGSASSVGASITFNDSSTGGSAHIVNNGGITSFLDNSVFGTASGALITNVNFGRTEFLGNSSLGTGSVVNNNAGALSFDGNATAASGIVTNNSGGSLSFSGASSAGSATISNLAGGTAVFTGNSIGGTATITNAGILSIGQDADFVSARIVNQAGGTTSISLINGTLRLGSLSGTGSVTLGANALQVGYLDLNETFAGVISGGGQLIKRGTGTFVLTGANTYTGTTTITAGTLQIDGSITSNTVIVGGTTLRGIGTITGNITNNGIFNAGNAANPTGTLHVTGNYQGNANSLFLVNIAGANSNLLQATGSLTLGGSTVRPQAAPGTFFLMQNDYRIAVGGSRNDNFAGIDESLLPSFIDASLFYTSTEAFLRLRRNATTFAQTAGLTPNQSAVSTSLDAAVAANNPLVFTTYLSTYNALLGLPANALPGALNILSGDALTAVPVAAQDHATRFAHRLDAYTWSNSSNLWGLIAYGDQNADSDGNGPGFDANGLEFQMGFNTSLGANTRVGLSVGYNDGDLDIGERLASADIETWSVGAQLRHDFGQLYASGQLTYSWHSIDSSRTLFLAGTANASYDANTLTAGGELGWVIHSGQLAIEPHVSVRYANTSTDAFSEAGPVGALNVAAADYETTRLGLGLRLANRDPAAPVRFYALVRYEREMGDEQSALDNAMPGLPTFRVVGTHLGDDVLTGDVGVEFRISNGLSLFAAGGGHTRSNETSLNANAGLRIVF